jgi:hypothetical protein
MVELCGLPDNKNPNTDSFATDTCSISWERNIASQGCANWMRQRMGEILIRGKGIDRTRTKRLSRAWLKAVL